jgi:hypothetical protein
MIHTKLQAGLRNLKFLFGCRVTGQNTDQGRRTGLLRGSAVDFEVDCPGCARFDALGLAVKDTTKIRGA